MNDFGATAEEIMRLEAKMFGSLFRGLEEGVIYEEAIDAARSLDDLSNVYFGTKNGDGSDLVICKGLEELMTELKEGHVGTWTVSTGAVSAGYDLLPWHDLERLDEFEKILKIAPKEINVTGYLAEIEKNRKLIEEKRKLFIEYKE
ncbi:hypothetical protein K8R30_01865 [archaeon]|nr:hypothetical protein [archaeon]